MKIITTGTIFVFLAVMAGIFTATPAFADHATAQVSNPPGSGSTDACAATNECFIPFEVTIDVGGEVTWTNDDTLPHTVTNGDLAVDPDNVGTVFDSGLLMAGATFSHKFDAAGEYPYFCMVHPWMKGMVIVQEAMAEEEEHMEDEMMESMTMIEGMSSDGSIKVAISASTPSANEKMTIDVKFMDATGKMVEHINYDITATQSGKNVLSDMKQHQHGGSASHTTMALASGDPVDVKVTILGIGINPPFTGPQGDVVMFTVVPEFGTIAVMILGVAIVSIIALTTRTKLIPRL